MGVYHSKQKNTIPNSLQMLTKISIINSTSFSMSYPSEESLQIVIQILILLLLLLTGNGGGGFCHSLALLSKVQWSSRQDLSLCVADLVDCGWLATLHTFLLTWRPTHLKINDSRLPGILCPLLIAHIPFHSKISGCSSIIRMPWVCSCTLSFPLRNQIWLLL